MVRVKVVVVGSADMDDKDKGKDPEFLARKQRFMEKRKQFSNARFFINTKPPVDKPDKPDKPGKPAK